LVDIGYFAQSRKHLEMKIYRGSCHCRRVKFEIRSNNIFEDIYRCDCSLCLKKAIVMKAEHKSHFNLLEGAEQLSSYKWNKMIAEHFFCQNCGVYTHHKRRRDPQQICINFACLDDVAMPDDANIGLTDGANHD